MRAFVNAAFTAMGLVVAVQGQAAASLPEALTANPDLSNFTSFLQSFPEVVSQLENLTNITIAAPTNGAFAEALDTDILGLDLDPIYDANNIALIQYHILKGTEVFDQTGPIETLLHNSSYTKLVDGAVVTYKQQSHTFLSGAGLQSGLIVRLDPIIDCLSPC